MVLIPPQARPSGPVIAGNHEARIRQLERRPRTSGPRHVYGRVYNDGSELWAGSGDWTPDSSDGWIVITISPPFTEGYEVQITPNDNGDTISTPPDLVQLSGLSYSGFVQAIQFDLATFAIMFWDLDGNPIPGSNLCGFDFEAVGT